MTVALSNVGCLPRQSSALAKHCLIISTALHQRGICCWPLVSTQRSTTHSGVPGGVEGASLPYRLPSLTSPCLSLSQFFSRAKHILISLAVVPHRVRATPASGQYACKFVRNSSAPHQVLFTCCALPSKLRLVILILHSHAAVLSLNFH